MNDNVISIDTKTCRECGQTKPINDFEKGRRKCRACLYKQRQRLKKAKEQDNINPQDINIEMGNDKETPKEMSKKEPRKIGKEKAIIKTNIELLLQGGFSFAAQRAGEHWNISETEASNIATPAANIIERLMEIETVNKNMDYIMLISAIGMTVVPRFIISNQLNQNKGGKDNVIREGRKPEKDNVRNINRANRADRDNAEQTKNDGGKDFTIDEHELYNESILQTVF